jgi:steroid 5-alpha reductase family enzyme
VAVWLQILIGWIVIAVMMAALWAWQRRTGNAGIVDVGWTAGLGILAVWYAAVGCGSAPYRILVAIMAGVWATRLATYVLIDRVVGKPEDGRYQTLKSRWGERAQRRLFVFFQAQGVVDVVMSAPFLIIASYPGPLRWWAFVGLAVWAIAVGGELAADAQLAAFRRDAANKGHVCHTGLWLLSRHPNYFFEWLHWWSYVIVAVGGPSWYASLVSPALISFFLFRVTGIPATERQAVETKGDEYRDYQRTTSAFVPWAPKTR